MNRSRLALPLPRRGAIVLASSFLLLWGAQQAAVAADKTAAPNAARRAVDAGASLLVKVENAWIRPTVKGQTASGGYMSLTASRDLTLVGFGTSAAGETELHDMVMDGSVMRMRAIESLSLPAGKTITLRPGHGGQHLMLMDLKQQLKEGEDVVLTLKLRTPDGKLIAQEIKVPVRSGHMMHGMGGASVPQHGQQHHHGQ